MNQNPRSFDDIEIGDEIGPVTKVPTTEMVKRYAAAVQMPSDLRFFFETEAARQQGFANPVVPGPLNTTFLSQILKDYFVGWQLRTLNATFRTPAAHGERLSLWGMVTEKTRQDGIATVHCDVVIENEQGDRILVGTATLSRREPLD